MDAAVPTTETPTEPGATIYSVAQRAGVSIATVSRVLRGKAAVASSTRERVLAAVDELAYVPHGGARSLAVRHHEALGLVLPELCGPYYSELLMGFEARSAELGQSVVLVLADSKPDVAPAVRQLVTRVDGIAVLGAPASSPDVARALHGRKPVVIIAGDPQDGIESITAENRESAEELTRHVLEHGRTRLLFVGDPNAAPDIRDRHAGFVAAHTRNGLTAMEPVRIPFRERDGERFAARLLEGAHDADGLICGNDELALSIMTGLQDAGVEVPGEVAVVGWDDVMTARYVRPGLTTVRQPVHDLGTRAAARLHELVSGSEPRSIAHVLPTEVVLRGSCGCDHIATSVRRNSRSLAGTGQPTQRTHLPETDH